MFLGMRHLQPFVLQLNSGGGSHHVSHTVLLWGNSAYMKQNSNLGTGVLSQKVLFLQVRVFFLVSLLDITLWQPKIQCSFWSSDLLPYDKAGFWDRQEPQDINNMPENTLVRACC